MADPQRDQALQRLKVAKIHVSPYTLERSPRRVAARCDSLWAPVERLAESLDPLPTTLIRFVAEIPRGHIVLSAAPSSYEAGAQTFRGHELEAVACISLTDLIEAPVSALQMVGHLLDHLLGCAGLPHGRWLSHGHGLSDAWMEIGSQIPELFELGHGVDQAAKADPQPYFARSVAWYMQDRPRLNVADPLIERLLRRSVFDEGFCARTLRGRTLS
jgi:hypothetical protein